MVAYYFEAGPRQGLPEKWVANNGISMADFVRLAKAEKLNSLMVPAGKLTSQHLEVFLRINGPVWCAGHWDGLPHIVVLTGVENGSVYINDPNPGKRQRVETLDWFNTKLDRIPNCMMVRKR
jgi:ABC-type bacteriocin/lantibiotic exporter with double-glycine peptidase domain